MPDHISQLEKPVSFSLLAWLSSPEFDNFFAIMLLDKVSLMFLGFLLWVKT